MPGRKRLALGAAGLTLAAEVAARRLQLALADDVADGTAYACTVPLGPELRGQLDAFHVQAQALAGHAPPAAPVRAVTRSALLHLRALQALDAAQASASHREIAQVLFGLEAVVLRWHEDGELRAQVRHLLRRARAYRDGGYLALAGVRRALANLPGDEPPR
ncbi:DNA -binding domain-containing protein [Variovorax sp. ZT4R33]|uniref:DNA -binding domain-containing protein n=1 Tax=Variovorax sp. ZT4R33 TaxID=3443743 RepID=UPI003F44F905